MISHTSALGNRCANPLSDFQLLMETSPQPSKDLEGLCPCSVDPEKVPSLSPKLHLPPCPAIAPASCPGAAHPLPLLSHRHQPSTSHHRASLISWSLLPHRSFISTSCLLAFNCSDRYCASLCPTSSSRASENHGHPDNAVNIPSLLDHIPQLHHPNSLT